VNAREGAEVIRAVAESLRNNPDQFHININVTGQKITSHGGTGLSIAVVGGGPASSTIGQTVTVGGADVEVARARGEQAFDEQYSELLDVLEQIAAELEGGSPDTGMLGRLHNSLLGTWVPGVVTSVVGSVLAHTVGM